MNIRQVNTFVRYYFFRCDSPQTRIANKYWMRLLRVYISTFWRPTLNCLSCSHARRNKKVSAYLHSLCCNWAESPGLRHKIDDTVKKCHLCILSIELLTCSHVFSSRHIIFIDMSLITPAIIYHNYVMIYN